MGARLGQHFLHAVGPARILATSLTLNPTDVIVEIGPGKGALTKWLLQSSNCVYAIEKDEFLAQGLMRTFSKEIAEQRLIIVVGDIRTWDPKSFISGEYVVAANIPYYITGEIIRQFLTAQKQPHSMALLIQKEVAERIIARDKKESLLSLSVKAYGVPRIVSRVGKGAFSPPPNVDSAIIAIEHISRTFFDTISEHNFFDILHTGFGSKRKQLGGTLEKKYGESARVALRNAGIPENTRPEDLSLEKWKTLTKVLKV